jgi:hypothetical protein
MATETTVDESADAEPEEEKKKPAGKQRAPEGAATAEGGTRQRKQRAGNRDFNEFAFREMRRARKLFSAETDGSEAQFAIQMAHVAALLDLAEAVRGRNGDGGDAD